MHVLFPQRSRSLAGSRQFRTAIQVPLWRPNRRHSSINKKEKGASSFNTESRNAQFQKQRIVISIEGLMRPQASTMLNASNSDAGATTGPHFR